MRIGQLLLECPHLVPVLAHLTVELLEVLVDLVRVVSPHDPRELTGCGFLEEVAELAEVFERLGRPGIVGEILAGVLIGPHVLGWLAPSEFLRTLSDLGVMFLLFRVGLEVKASELMKVGGIALLVALSGVIVPFFAGWAICALWGQPRLESVFTGAAMVATSVGITAQVLASRGLLDKRASRIILTAAVV